MKIQHKRSAALNGGVAKEPTADQTEFGELCVNFNTADPALFIRDNADNIVRIGGDLSLYQKSDEVGSAVFVCSPSEIDAQSPPSERLEGALWWNTEEGVLFVWYEDADSEQWVIAVPQSSIDDIPPGTSVGITPPSGAEEGQMWWNSDEVEQGGGRLYVYYDNAWIDTSVPGGKGSYITEDEAKGLFLSKTTDDTAAGAITFEGLTTHENGITLTGGHVRAGGGKTGSVRSFYGSGTLDQNTTDARLFYSNNSYTGTGTLPSVYHFQAQPNRPSSTLTITDQMGFLAGSNLTANTVTNAYGFYSDLGIGPGNNYNFYAAGDAPNYFEGQTIHQSGASLRGAQTSVISDTFVCQSALATFRGASTDADAYALNVGLYQKAAVTDGAGIRLTTGTSNGFARTSYKAIDIKDIKTNTAGETRYGVYSNLGTSPAENYNFYAAGAAPNYFAGEATFSSDPNQSAVNILPAIDNPMIRVGPSVLNSDWSTTNDEGTRIRPKNIRVHNPDSGSSSSCLSLRRLNSSTGVWIDFLVSENKPVQGTIRKINGSDGIAITGLAGGPLLRNGFDLDSTGGLVEVLKQAYDTIQELKSRIDELESNTLQPLYSTFADLPSASDHHGKVAHVHDEGALYFAHSGSWVKLQNA